ncbi:MAG: hypothetical protein EPO42_13390 [Gallionellaceae bacterium]|nr:MAG: hypothetical protein EPO42_13390 [Gallionellaceae bacterium]
MFSQVSVAVLGSLFSLSSLALEPNDAEDKKRRAGKTSRPSFESLVDIHNSKEVLAHPTVVPGGAQSIAELKRLQAQSDAREKSLRSWYQSRGEAYPERFAGD